MPVELQVIRASEFIRFDARAHLDFKASQQALQTLARACRTRGLDRAMVDLRMLPVLAKPHFTPTELAALISSFCDAGFSGQQRLAVLYQNDVHGGIRSFAFIGRLRGLEVQAFTDFESALQWLSEQGSRHESQAGEVAVPISHPECETAIPPEVMTMRQRIRATTSRRCKR
jgi:hypothetical protein